MIVGGHIMIQSKNESADKAFFRDALKLPCVDAGGGFLIFGLPPSEFAVHEGESGHELYLMCADIEEFLGKMAELGITATPAQDQGWGVLTNVTLPGGGKLSVYQPRHKRPKQPAARLAKKAKPTKKTPRKTAKPKTKKRTKNKR